MSLQDTITRKRPAVHVYRTAPQKERKAEQELRQAGVPAFVPTETKTVRLPRGKTRTTRRPLAPGYVFAAAKPYFVKHVKEHVGSVALGDFLAFHQRGRITHDKPSRPFKVGDRVMIKVGPFADLPATIIADRGRAYLVKLSMLGKEHTAAVHEKHMHRLIDPGG